MTPAAETGEANFPAFRVVLGATTYALELAIVVAIYLGLAEAALLVPAINSGATPLWPPTAVALALVLIRGRRIWPGIALGAFAANALPFVFSSSVAQGLWLQPAAVAIGTTLAAVAGTSLLDRWTDRPKVFASLPGVGKFIVVAFVPVAMIGAITAMAAPILATSSNRADFVAGSVGGAIGVWTPLWLGDAAGILLITPVIVLWVIAPPYPLGKQAVVDTVATIVGTIVIGMAFCGPAGGTYLGALPHRELFGFLIALPLLWTGLRGRQRDAATAALIFCSIASWAFSTGLSPFDSDDANGALLLLLAVVITIAAASLLLSAAVAAHRDTEVQLLRQFEQTQLSFKNARRHFQIFIENVVDYAIFVLDASGRIASWNTTAEKIIGYKSEEIVGKHFGILYRPDERRGAAPNRALEMALQHGRHEVEGWRIKKNGTPFFVTGAVTAIRDDDGNLLGFAKVMRDATERRDTQEKLSETREQLAMAQKMEAIGKLTGGIAHDFNNLLMIIGGNAQTFRRLLDPKLPRAIEAIQTAAKRGESLTRQLLTFSRRQHLSPTVVDPAACIKNMRTLIESSLRGNIVYEEKIGSAIWPVKVDLAELELAIVNIAVNARDAMPNGGSFTLTVANAKADQDHPGDRQGADFVAIEFTDTGMGIPPNLLSKVFDPFFTTKEVGKGTGLGLSQVYGFAHQAGGTVHADSKVGEGTTITMFLPSCAGEEITPEEAADGEPPRAPRPMVLVVDDSAEVAEVTSSLFEALGYDTVYSDSAESALKLLADGAKIDLVFSDIVMPGPIDGVGLANEVRSLYPRLPVVLTTGYSDAAQGTPANLRILRKPFDTETLRCFIQDTMEATMAS
jgi:PAS domain S-box-containing protein